ncbi:MAG: adenylate kinase [Clostridia bacterium]|nr:adenylate kinase [Clostridia bacterium]
MKLILLGAPGAGKGTQAENISGRYEIPTISTGNMIRAAIHNGTELGKKAESLINAGKLVPDEVVIGMVKERLAEDDCKNGFILDGFPRTIPQAEALEKMGIEIDMALSIEVADEKIVQRMSGRRVCPACGMTYHVDFKPSKDNEHCNECGADLIIRKDDHPDTVLDRLKTYHETTEPLKAFYDARGKLAMVEGREELAETTKATFETIEAFNK